MPTKKKTTSKVKRRASPQEQKFIVRSAQEAVTQVREVLGPNAQVISVRQVKGAGLQRFLASPRLEIVARASQDTAENPVEKEAPVSENRGTEESSPKSPNQDTASKELLESGEAKDRKTLESNTSDASEAGSKTPGDILVEDRLKKRSVKDMKCGQFLERAGFSAHLLSRLSSNEEWRAICEMPLAEGITKTVFHLREDRKRRPEPELGRTIAFVGGAGSGKTTALCKVLARDTFIRNRSPQVLRIEPDKPHMDDGLPLYCDVLGIRCVRSEADLDPNSEDPVYIDVPGYSLRGTGEISRIRTALDELGVESRILVMNGAYESAVLRRFWETGEQLDARFQIVSHVDELISFGKLWEYLFDVQRHLLNFSSGQNVASDLVEDPFGFLIERTFPR